jgi:hypothetical protein
METDKYLNVAKCTLNNSQPCIAWGVHLNMEGACCRDGGMVMNGNELWVFLTYWRVNTLISTIILFVQG